MTPLEFEGLLSRVIGLDAASISSAAIERAVRSRLKACGLDWAAYWEKVQGPGEELRELIEAVVVPETWFFRDREAFAVLGRLATEEGSGADGVMRFLSFPCSTGEEPYSLAMALLEAGVPAERFRVDGFDVSRRALAQAREGLYGRNSFRGGDLGFRDRHFTPEGREWRLSEAARGQVRFQEANLLDASLAPGALYDAIFCRNVLIYFDREAQERALGTLTRLLAPEGLLFVGPSETSLAGERGFSPIGVPQSFAFRKETSEKRKAREAAATPQASLPAWVPLSPPPLPPRHVAAPLPFSSAAPTPVPPAEEDGLAAARLLADQGRLADAALRCEAHLQEYGPSAEGYYLLGVVRDAQGNRAEAAAFYRKALYLDPAHGEVMIHLATLLEHEGNAGGAQALSERARRLAGKKGA